MAAPQRQVTPARVGAAGAGAALIAVALNLRVTVAAVSPVLTAIQRSTGLSSVGLGLLTAVPVFCFAAFSLGATVLIRRVGMAPLLLVAMLAVAGGAAVRLLPDTAALFAGTVVIGAGIALANVAMPGLIKRDFSDRVSLMMGLYSMCLFVGPALSVGLTVPIEHAAGFGWRPAVALWGILAVVAAVVWAPFSRSRPSPGSTAGGPGTSNGAEARGRAGPAGLWTDRLAWQVTFFMGLQSLGYYATLNWVPTILEAHHLSAAEAGWLLSYSAFPGMVTALATPVLVRRSRRPATFVVYAVASCAVGYAVLLFAPASGAYVSMTFLGVGQALAITQALSFIVARAPDAHHAAHLSTMSQGIGYLLASSGPFLLGALHALTGGWTVPLLLLLATLVPLLAAGLGACRDRYVLEPAAGGAPGRGSPDPG